MSKPMEKSSLLVPGIGQVIEAKYYRLAGDKVECRLCPNFCSIAPGKVGICRVRKNEDNKLWSLCYGETTSVAIDPIEKKPLYHFYPGSQILSISPNGCNMRCPFCQNWEISQVEAPTQPITTADLVQACRKHKLLGVSYTYTEPLIWFEYLLDAALAVHKAGFKNVLVTNGMIEEEPLRDLLPLIDAMNIDLKSIKPEVYKKVLHGDLKAVKRTIEISKQKCLVELTNLLVSNLNDSKEEISELIRYVASLGRDTILHFSRYFPQWKFDQPVTADSTLEYAYDEAAKELDFVYLGNVAGTRGSNTYCPKCKTLLIERVLYHTKIGHLVNSACQKCGNQINLVM